MSIGLTVGCWDRLHEGHRDHIREALSGCDVLIVGVMSQTWMRLTKGVPIEGEGASEDESTREHAIYRAFRGEGHRIRPVRLDVPVLGALAQVVDVVFLGSDQTWHLLPENRRTLDSCAFETIPRLPGVSSSGLRSEAACLAR